MCGINIDKPHQADAVSAPNNRYCVFLFILIKIVSRVDFGLPHLICYDRTNFPKEQPLKINIYAMIHKKTETEERTLTKEERSKIRRHNYYLKNKVKLRAYDKQYNIKNKKKKRKYLKNYRVENKDVLSHKKKAIYQKNKIKICAYQRQYQQENKEWRYLYQLMKYMDNPYRKSVKVLRDRIYQAIKRLSGQKESSSKELLGCSFDQARQHLESQFKPGMHWGNNTRKGWHIDHIIPCSSFDLTKLEEQKKCFHWTNLQPLWWYDNLHKSDKISFYQFLE